MTCICIRFVCVGVAWTIVLSAVTLFVICMCSMASFVSICVFAVVCQMRATYFICTCVWHLYVLDGSFVSICAFVVVCQICATYFTCTCVFINATKSFFLGQFLVKVLFVIHIKT